MINDLRYKIIKERLEYLTIDQLEKILNYPDEMVLDTYNFDGDKYCPLAVAFDLQNKFDKNKVTDHFIKNEIKKEANSQIPNFKINPTKGIVGEFYTKNRKEDLITLAKEILKEKYESNKCKNSC